MRTTHKCVAQAICDLLELPHRELVVIVDHVVSRRSGGPLQNTKYKIQGALAIVIVEQNYGFYRVCVYLNPYMGREEKFLFHGMNNPVINYSPSRHVSRLKWEKIIIN